MQTKNLIYISIMALLVSACAATSKPFVGVPNAYANVSPKVLKDKAVSSCVEHGGRVVSEGSSSVTCAAPMDDSMQSFAFRALVTPQNSTNPDITWQMTWKPERAGVHIYMNGWVEYQNAFGQVTRVPVGDEAKWGMQKTLDESVLRIAKK